MIAASAKTWGAWHPREIEIAADIWQRAVTDIYGDDDWTDGVKMRAYQLIARKLGRTVCSVTYRFVSCGPSFSAARAPTMNVAGGMRVSEQALADRAARYDANQLRDLTAATFGDPPVGFSALDRRRR
jgi:hypothetical protein